MNQTKICIKNAFLVLKCFKKLVDGSNPFGNLQGRLPTPSQISYPSSQADRVIATLFDYLVLQGRQMMSKNKNSQVTSKIANKRKRRNHKIYWTLTGLQNEHLTFILKKCICNWMCFLVYMLQSLCLTTFPFSALGPLCVILSTLPLPGLFCCAEMTQATFITISASTFGVVHAWIAVALVVKLPLHKNRQRHLVWTWLVMDLPWLVWSICRHSVNLWHDLLVTSATHLHLEHW